MKLVDLPHSHRDVSDEPGAEDRRASDRAAPFGRRRFVHMPADLRQRRMHKTSDERCPRSLDDV
jgi:hypothetical protein